MLACSFSCFIILIYDLRHEKRSGKYIFWIVLFFIIAASYIVQTDIFEKIFTRIGEINIDSAFDDSRKYQNQNLFDSIKNIVTGSGLGSGSANARRIGLTGITDGNYMKLLYEEGIIGLFLFVGVILRTLLRAYRYFKYYSVEFCIIVSILIAMMGSNSLTMPFYIIPFWYAIGTIWNKSVLQERIQDNKYL